MNDDRNQEPGKRLRSILSSKEEETNAQPQPQNHSQPQSPLSRLPHRRPSAETAPAAQPAPLPTMQAVAPQALAKTPPPAPPPVSPPQEASSPQEVSSPQGEQPPQKARARRNLKLGPPFWTVTGILSLIVNAVLIAVLLVLYNTLGQLQSLQGAASNIGGSVLGGLYSNFEKMDRSTIKTVIPVDAQIPLDISVPVQTTTQITLAETVNIPNAQVVINTGGLNINSNARVSLPAGTPLLVNLNFNLPVQTTIPVHLEVPVNIPMSQTELHEPFVGLQDVVRPWYCLVEPSATNVDGLLVCQ
jgi:hypothetical protein